jgi:DNA-binding response OmpR family regulator
MVEDDPATARVVADSLEDAEYRVEHAVSGNDARGKVERLRPDLILLDLMLPDVDGLVLCTTLKSLTDAPIVVCSASSRRADPVLALKLGADDFIRKPFEMDDLLARVEAVLRRAPPASTHSNVSATSPRQSPELRVGQLVVEPARRRARLGGAQLTLTPTEFRLLAVLAAAAEQVCSREQLAQEVWGLADLSHGRTIDVHIRRLRLKLSRGARPGPSIASVRGTGYRLTAADAATSAA